LAKEKAWGWIDENRKHVVELSDRVWEYAELGLVEERSSKLLADELERHSFEAERGVAGMPTAFVATWSNGEGPTIGLLGEYDALPGLNNEKVPRKEPLGCPGSGCATTFTASQRCRGDCD
jgi:aminobenzoyl-glutamate utilization protein B